MEYGRGLNAAVVVVLCAMGMGGTTVNASTVLTPYRTSDVWVQTRYPVKIGVQAITLTSEDSAENLFGGYVTKTATVPNDATNTPYGTADAASSFGKAHARTTATRSADLKTTGATRATGSFGDGFIVQSGPANGVASVAFVFEGALVNGSSAALDATTSVGAWAVMDVSLRGNYVGGDYLFRSRIHPNQVVSSFLAPGVTVGFGPTTGDTESFSKTVIISFPYQSGLNYFLDLSLHTSASLNASADFFHTGSVGGVTLPEGAWVSFDSGTPASVYGAVPEPATVGVMLLAVGGLFGGRRPRRAVV